MPFGAQFQQAYAYAKQNLWEDVSVDGRIGEINIPWGLSTAIPGGLFYAVNAIDFPAVTRPGAQAAEVTIPTPGAFGRLNLLQNKATLRALPGPEKRGPGLRYVLRVRRLGRARLQ
jgi:hypothetical protein